MKVLHSMETEAISSCTIKLKAIILGQFRTPEAEMTFGLLLLNVRMIRFHPGTAEKMFLHLDKLKWL